MRVGCWTTCGANGDRNGVSMMIRLLEKSGAASAAIGRRRGRRRRIVNSWWQSLVAIPGDDLLLAISWQRSPSDDISTTGLLLDWSSYTDLSNTGLRLLLSNLNC